jgi:hypothetical protein
MQEDGSDESAPGEYKRNPGVVVDVPPPLIGLLTMKASRMTKFLDSTNSIWWVSSVIEAWKRIRVLDISRGNGKLGLAHMAVVVLLARQRRSSCMAESERQP